MNMLAAFCTMKNEPNLVQDPALITELERYHDNYENKECRTYKLLGIHLDEFLTLYAHTSYIVSKLSRFLYLTYCTAIMSILNKKNRTRIFKIEEKQ